VTRDAELAAVLSARLAARSASDWQTDLLAAGVPALRADGIEHASFMLDHPHCRINGIAVQAEQPGTPLSARAGPALEFSEQATPVEAAAELGSHTASVLRGLGYSEQAIAELEARGITRAVGNQLPS